MTHVYIGKGNLAGKAVFAGRDFKKGEVVIAYNLQEITDVEFQSLPKEEKQFTHRRQGKIFLYGEPARYVNHSKKPNTEQDFRSNGDIALRDIKKDEMITCDATKDDTE